MLAITDRAYVSAPSGPRCRLRIFFYSLPEAHIGAPQWVKSKQLLCDEPLRRKMGLVAQSKIERCHTRTQTLEKLERVYRELLGLASPTIQHVAFKRFV